MYQQLPFWNPVKQNGKSVIIYNGNSFTDAPDLLFSANFLPSCALFHSKKHNSRPVVLVVSGQNAQIYDYTIADSWEETTSPPVKFYFNSALQSLSNNGVIIQTDENFYEFSCDVDECSWTTKPQKLIESRTWGTIVMPLPPNFPC